MLDMPNQCRPLILNTQDRAQLLTFFNILRNQELYFLITGNIDVTVIIMQCPVYIFRLKLNTVLLNYGWTYQAQLVSPAIRDKSRLKYIKSKSKYIGCSCKYIRSIVQPSPKSKVVLQWQLSF